MNIFIFFFSAIDMRIVNEHSFLEQWGVHIAALFISCVAVFVSLRGLYLTKKHNKLCVKPDVRTDLTKSGKRELQVLITNCGLGPMKVENIEYKYKKKTYTTIKGILTEEYEEIHQDCFRFIKDIRYDFPITYLSGEHAALLEIKSLSIVPIINQIINDKIEFQMAIDFIDNYNKSFHRDIKIKLYPDL